MPTPVGTNLQLVDQDDDDFTRPQNTVPPQVASEVASEEPPNRRYPVRERRPPARLNDYVLSSIRDVCSKEGGDVRQAAIEKET